jgi:hypothetical protein
VDTELSTAQRKQLHNALVQAFRTWTDLRLFADLELGLNLATVATEQNVTTAALDLISWALAHGRLSSLIEAMCAARPDNLTVLACRDLLSDTSSVSIVSTANPPRPAQSELSPTAWATTSITTLSISLVGIFNGSEMTFQFFCHLSISPPPESFIALGRDCFVRFIIDKNNETYIIEQRDLRFGTTDGYTEYETINRPAIILLYKQFKSSIDIWTIPPSSWLDGWRKAKYIPLISAELVLSPIGAAEMRTLEAKLNHRLGRGAGIHEWTFRKTSANQKP